MPKKTKRSKRSTSTASKKKSTSKVVATQVNLIEKYVVDLRKIFSNRKNMVTALVVLIVFSALYLFKDTLIVATVNGRPIYRWTIVKQLEEQGGRQVLDSLVTEALVEQAVKDAGVVVDRTEIDASIAEIEARLASQGLTLEQALAQEGLTLDQLGDDLTLQLAVDQLLRDQVVISEEAIDQYIENNSEFLPEGLEGDDLRAEVREQLSTSEMNNVVQAWIQDLQDEAKIIYFKDYGGVSF